MRKTTLTIILVFVVLSALLSSCFLARGILGVKTPSPKTEILIYWATYEGVFNKPKNKRLAEEIVRRNEQDSLNIKAYYVNFDKRENIQLCTSTLKGR